MIDQELELVLQHVFNNKATQGSAGKYINSLVTDFIDRPTKSKSFYENFIMNNQAKKFQMEEINDQETMLSFSQKIKD